jgi:hypothetical protein
MEENSISKNNYYLGISLVLLLILFYITGLMNPFVFSYTSFKVIEILGIILTFLILFFMFFIILSFRFDKLDEKILYFFFTFLIGYIIIIGPGLTLGGLFNNDSFLHLYIVKKFIIEEETGVFFTYGDFFLHRFFAYLSQFSGIDPHFYFLYLVQFLFFTIYFIGIYLIIFNLLDLEPPFKQFIFLILIFFPNYLFQNSAFHPFYFLTSLMPIVIYLTLKINLKNSVILIIICFLAIQSHVYGQFIPIISIGLLIIKFILVKYIIVINDEIKYMNLIVIIWLFYGFSILLILVPNIIKEIIVFLPIDPLVKSVLTRGIDSGGATTSENSGAVPLVHSIFSFSNKRFFGVLEIIIDWSLFYVPLFSTIIMNQLFYLKSIKEKVHRINNLFYLRIYCDLYFFFFIISLAYGADFFLERTILLVFFSYIIISFNNLLNLAEIIKNKLSRTIPYFRQNNIFSKENLKFIIILLIITFSFIPFTNYRNDTIVSRYDAIDWIKDNILENSIILASISRLNHVIKGMTNLDTISDSSDLFNLNLNDTIAINQFLSNFSNQNVYIILDKIDDLKLDIVWTGNPCVGSNINCISIKNTLNIMMTSDHYNILYNNTEILIFNLIK